MKRFLLLLIVTWPLEPIRGQVRTIYLRIVGQEQFKEANSVCSKDEAELLTLHHHRYKELLECAWSKNEATIGNAPFHTTMWIEQVNETLCRTAIRKTAIPQLEKIRNYRCSLQVKSICLRESRNDSFYKTPCEVDESAEIVNNIVTLIEDDELPQGDAPAEYPATIVIATPVDDHTQPKKSTTQAKDATTSKGFDVQNVSLLLMYMMISFILVAGNI